ncbi:MAG: hypothetical protein ABJC13_25040 [Acidobacteriota bacterium]
MSDPFAFLQGPARWVVFLVLVVATVLYSIALGNQGEKLKNSVATQKVVSLELAWTQDRAAAIIKTWVDDSKLDLAKKQIHWDFGFLMLYPLAFSLACSLLARSPKGLGGPIGFVIAWSMLAALPLDATENIFMLRMLNSLGQGVTKLDVLGASLAAGIKFVVLSAACGYILVQGLLLLWKRVFP